MKSVIKYILKEEIKDGRVFCDGCGWNWKLSEGGDDKYICHKCGHDNTPKKSNLDTVLFNLSENLIKQGYHKELSNIASVVKKYIEDNNFTVKFLNSCSTGFGGVRTKNEVIVCSPMQMQTLGDFLYTIFHELRHESQIRDIKMENPFDSLDDFEKFYEIYWEMELDADQFAKNMVARLVKSNKIPMNVAENNFKLSEYIKHYPNASKIIKESLRYIVEQIKKMREEGKEFSDISDLPMVKKHLDKLENFI